MHEWNLCGNACFSNTVEPADVAIVSVAGGAPRPWSASFVEVCHSSNQHFRMVNALDDFGYHPETYAARTNFAGCGGANFGNSVFAVGSDLGVSRYTFPSQDGTPEARGVVCSSNSGFLGNWQACSTHLDSSALAATQEGQLYDVAALGGTMLSIYGGDFNLEPGVADFLKWRAAYDEIDEASPWVDTWVDADSPDTAKLDYIWARDSGAMSSPYGFALHNIAGADHHYYKGRFLVST